MIFANNWWVESKSLSANKPLIAGVLYCRRLENLTLLYFSPGCGAGARTRVTGLFMGEILTLCLENLFESSHYGRSFSVMLLKKM